MTLNEVHSITTEHIKDAKKIKQQIIGTSIHTVPTQYRILSKNDFGIYKNRINLGLFNKKTNFRISPKESIMAINKNSGMLENPTVEEIKNDPANFFLLWKYSFSDRNNDTLVLKDKSNNNTYQIELTYDFGKRIADNIYEDTDNIKYTTEEKLFINNFLEYSGTKISFNKNILLNSHYLFLMGLLSIVPSTGKIPNNINLYSISLIFNILEASYSIRKDKLSSSFIIRYKFSMYLYKLIIESNLSEKLEILNAFKFKFRNLKYFIYDKDGVSIESKYIKFYNKKEDISILHKNLDNLGINSGEIELIPCTDIIFEKLENRGKDKMIDLVMENDNAHNFFLGGTPLMKNSDGDILAAIALFTKEASREASDSFSASNKTKFINPANLNVQNWGVKTDSQLGLYNATK